MSETQLITQAVAAVVSAPDATIAPEHETRLQTIEQTIATWAPLVEGLAALAQKMGKP